VQTKRIVFVWLTFVLLIGCTDSATTTPTESITATTATSVPTLTATSETEEVPATTAIDGNKISGPYLGQIPPGETAKLFAPELLNTGLNVRDIAMSLDGKEFYFSTNTDNHSYSTIYVIKEENNMWTSAEIAPFATQTEYRFGEPFISPDGNKMYFVSTQPADGTNQANDYDIWDGQRR
jgi:Tol biopolymer transport system component